MLAHKASAFYQSLTGGSLRTQVEGISNVVIELSCGNNPVDTADVYFTAQGRGAVLGPILMDHTDRAGEYRSQIPFMPAVQQPTPEQIDDFCKVVTNDVNSLCSAFGDIKKVQQVLAEAVVCGEFGLVGEGACASAALVCKVFKAVEKIGSKTTSA